MWKALKYYGIVDVIIEFFVSTVNIGPYFINCIWREPFKIRFQSASQNNTGKQLDNQTCEF